MTHWDSEELPLRKGHRWHTRPGFSRLVLDRGAVGFDVPSGWVVRPGRNSTEVLDKAPPDDDVRLEVSFNRMAPGIDWSRAPLEEMVPELVNDDHREVLTRGMVRKLTRKGLRGAWTEFKFVDPVEHRVAYSRLLVAIGRNVQVLLTGEYWPEDAGVMRPAWDEALRTLELGLIIPDPTTGRAVAPDAN